MALQESLNKFKKQQELYHTTQTNIKPGLKPTAKVTPNTPTNARSPEAAVKFSSDTDRLSHINSIRKAPIGAQMKRVINFILEPKMECLSVRTVSGSREFNTVPDLSSYHWTRQAFTAEQINEACYVDVNGNKAVFDSLKNNLKVYYDGRHFSYKSKHNVKDKSQLLELIRKFPEGIAVVDLKDSYPSVMNDLPALKADGEIWLLSNFDTQEDTAYPNDPKVLIRVDDDLKQLFLGIELPRDMIDIEKDLQKNGMKPATNTAQRRATAHVHGIIKKPKQKKRNNDISNRTKLTNTHLLDLFKKLGS